jgi:hypothetical protein
MKKIILIYLISISSSVYADAAFDGANAQIGMGFANLGSDNNWTSYGQYKYGQKGALGNISFGYSRKLDNQFNLSANAFYTFGSDKSGGRPDDNNTIYKIKDVWGIVFEPGYYFSESSLGFLKVGYAKASSEFNDSYGKSNYGDSNGFLYGIGFKQMIQDNIFLGAETYQIDFSRSDTVNPVHWSGTTTNKPSLTYGGITLGYNFGSNYKYKSDKNNNPSTFNGLNAQFGFGFTEKSSRSDWPSGGSDRYDVSDKGALANLSIGYSYNLNHQFNIAGNVFYAPGNDDAGQWISGSYKWKIKDIWGASFEPGYYFTDNALGYLKLGYARADSEYQHTGGNADYGTTNGFLYGVGFKQLLTNNIYVGLETYQIDFSKSKTIISEGGYNTSNKPAVTYGGLMIGYKF